jgi:hypothetical protein
MVLWLSVSIFQYERVPGTLPASLRSNTDGVMVAAVWSVPALTDLFQLNELIIKSAILITGYMLLGLALYRSLKSDRDLEYTRYSVSRLQKS